jgi:hypothetical protein
VQQSRVLDDHGVGFQHWLTQTDSFTSIRQNAMTGAPIRSEPKREKLCEPALDEGRDR